MEAILKSIREANGVTASFVFNGSGQLAGYDGLAMYDEELLSHTSLTLVKAIESIQLQMEDWDAISAAFDDGKLFLKNLGSSSDGQPYVLAVVADQRLAGSFAAVALRVAVQKLKRLLAGGPGSSGVSLTPISSQPVASSRPPPPPPAAQPPSHSQRQASVASSGMTWSSPGGGAGSSSVEVADAASSAFLTRCCGELAKHAGPMSRLYVMEAARRVSPTAPFSIALAQRMVEDLAGQIEDADDRADFRKAFARA